MIQKPKLLTLKKSALCFAVFSSVAFCTTSSVRAFEAHQEGNKLHTIINTATAIASLGSGVFSVGLYKKEEKEDRKERDRRAEWEASVEDKLAELNNVHSKEQKKLIELTKAQSICAQLEKLANFYIINNIHDEIKTQNIKKYIRENTFIILNMSEMYNSENEFFIKWLDNKLQEIAEFFVALDGIDNPEKEIGEMVQFLNSRIKKESDDFGFLSFAI